MADRAGMLAYGVIAAMCLAGYAGWPWWTVLPAGVLLTIHAWWTQLWRLGETDHEPWSRKITAYFVTGIVADIVLAAVSFGLGRTLHWMAG